MFVATPDAISLAWNGPPSGQALLSSGPHLTVCPLDLNPPLAQRQPLPHDLRFTRAPDCQGQSIRTGEARRTPTTPASSRLYKLFDLPVEAQLTSLLRLIISRCFFVLASRQPCKPISSARHRQFHGMHCPCQCPPVRYRAQSERVTHARTLPLLYQSLTVHRAARFFETTAGHGRVLSLQRRWMASLHGWMEPGWCSGTRKRREREPRSRAWGGLPTAAAAASGFQILVEFEAVPSIDFLLANSVRDP